MVCNVCHEIQVIEFQILSSLLTMILEQIIYSLCSPCSDKVEIITLFTSWGCCEDQMCWHILGLNNGWPWLSAIKYLDSVISTFHSFLFIGVFLDYLDFFLQFSLLFDFCEFEYFFTGLYLSVYVNCVSPTTRCKFLESRCLTDFVFILNPSM